MTPVGMTFSKLLWDEVSCKSCAVNTVMSKLCSCVTVSLMTRQISYLSDYRMAVSQEGD